MTVTVKVQVLALPLLSQAVLVTVEVPTGKANPLAGTLEMFVTAQLSVAVTVKVTLLLHAAKDAFTERFVGQLITGGSVSWIVTTLVQLPLQPTESVTCRVRLNVPEEPALTTTEESVLEPARLPSPESDH
jgi:hypothetical protein